MLQSIKKTNRNITKISVYFLRPPDQTTFKSMISIIKKFSPTIKCFKYHGDIKLTDFVEILSSIPNVVNLGLDFVRTPEEIQPTQKRRRLMPSIDINDLNLHKLKTLKFQHCSDEFVVLFNRLPAGVLTELKLDHGNLDELKVLFMKQTNIKKLKMKWLNHNPLTHSIAGDLFDNQKLESLVWHYYDSNIHKVLCKQSNLKSLKLIPELFTDSDEDLMKVIADHLTSLKTFSIYFRQIPVVALRNINKLKNLTELTLRGDEREHVKYFEEFSRLDNSRIATLDIQFVYHISNDLIAALAKSVPNLKVLRFNCDYNFSTFNAIMRIFNFVEILHFDPLDGNFDYYYEYNTEDDAILIQNDCVNLNLIEFKITYQMPFKRVFLKKLIHDYPNLKKLVVDSKKPLNVSQFKLILTGFKKIESLSLVGGASKLTMDDLDCLKEHRNCLKFVSLMDLDEIKCYARNKKKLSKIFNVVNLTPYDGLQMAVDRNTMKSEEVYRSF